jgi:gamma-glutamylcyclotransferase (GGCT)/AIG2-like uncharacterized protein YtfP
MNEAGDLFRLFVYGLLKRGNSGYRHLCLHRHTRWLGRAKLRGRIVDLGAYPGLVLARHGLVHGELLSFDDPALWTLLDAYEDCVPADPLRSEYLRKEVALIGGQRAWVYLLSHNKARMIACSGGRWTAKWP